MFPDKGICCNFQTDSRLFEKIYASFLLVLVAEVHEQKTKFILFRGTIISASLHSFCQFLNMCIPKLRFVNIMRNTCSAADVCHYLFYTSSKS